MLTVKLLCLTVGQILVRVWKRHIFRCMRWGRNEEEKKIFFFSFHLHGILLGAGEAAHDELTLLEHEVSRCSVVEVQVSQDVAVMVQHAGPEGSIDVGAAFFTLSCARGPPSQRQVCIYLTPADRNHRVRATGAWTWTWCSALSFTGCIEGKRWSAGPPRWPCSLRGGVPASSSLSLCEDHWP